MVMFSIVQLRKLTGMSQNAFADEFHIARSTLKKWEQGINNPPEHYLYALNKLVQYEGYLYNVDPEEVTELLDMDLPLRFKAFRILAKMSYEDFFEYGNRVYTNEVDYEGSYLLTAKSLKYFEETGRVYNKDRHEWIRQLTTVMHFLCRHEEDYYAWETERLLNDWKAAKEAERQDRLLR